MDNAHLLSIPTLLMHGTHDALTSCDASEEFARRAGPTAEFIAWEGCRHDLHDEPQREAVFSSVAFWAKNRCIQTETIGRIGLSKGSFPRSAVGRASDCRVCIEGNPQASYTADF